MPWRLVLAFFVVVLFCTSLLLVGPLVFLFLAFPSGVVQCQVVLLAMDSSLLR
jgi:hypothetical protein